MFESTKPDVNNFPDVGSSGVNGDHDQDENDEESGKKGFGKAKQVMFYPFRKAKKQILRRRVKRSSSSSCSSSSISCSRRTNNCSDKRGFDGSVNQGCGFCLGKLSISDSKKGSLSDSNSRKFTDEMLRVLIEKNDFYSKESNPHLDVHVDTRLEQ